MVKIIISILLLGIVASAQGPYLQHRRTASRPPASAAFTPLSISGSWMYWLAGTETFSDAGTTPITDGGTVQQINDLSTDGSHDGTQGTAGQRPTYLADGFTTGKPAMRFDGTADNFYFDTAGALSQPFTVVIAGRFTNSSITSTLLFNDTSLRQVATTAFGFGSLVITGIPTNINVVAVCIINGASSELWTNGVQAATGDAGASAISANTTGNSVMSRRDSDANWTAGFLSGMVIYNSAISAGNIASLQTFWMGKMQ